MHPDDSSAPRRSCVTSGTGRRTPLSANRHARIGMSALDTSCAVNVNNLMKMDRSAGRIALVITLFLMVTLSSAPLSANPFAEPQDLKTSIPGPASSLLSHKWGSCTTAVKSARPLSMSVFHAGTICRGHEPTAVAPRGNHPAAAPFSGQWDPARAYLHNLKLRC